jgi:ethanolamine permease
MLIAFAVTVVIAWWVTITAVSIRPGVSEEFMDPYIVFPMHFAFEQMFHFVHQPANGMMVPTLLSSVMGFMYASGRQMYSMSKSGLLPSFLSKTYGKRKTPLVAMITTACIGVCTLLPVWGFNPNADDLYELCMIGACCVYISMFWCYIIFKIRYDSMDRQFINPFGIASAIYGILYFALVLTTLLFAQLDFNALCAFTPYVFIAIVYYYQVVESRQFFSKDEQQQFMKAYILNGK